MSTIGVVPVSGSSYVISNVKSGTVIDLSVVNNKTVTGKVYNSSKNQLWTLIKNGSGWIFLNNNTGDYMGIQSTPANGLPIVAVAEPFAWNICYDEVNPKTFRISVPNTDQNLDLNEFGSETSESGDPITLWKIWDTLNQTWSFH